VAVNVGEAYVQIGSKMAGLARGLSSAKSLILGWAIEVGKKIFEATASREKAFFHLDTSLRGVGRSGGEAAAEMRDLVEELAATSRLSTEQAARYAAVAVGMTKTTSQAKELTRAAVGLAAQFESAGFTIDAAMEAIRSEQFGEADATLSRLLANRGLDRINAQQERLRIISNAAAEGLKTEAAAAETLDGRLAKLQQEFTGSLADIGEYLKKPFAEGLQYLTNFMNGVRDRIQIAPTYFDKLKAYAMIGVAGIADTFFWLLDVIQNVFENIVKMGSNAFKMIKANFHNFSMDLGDKIFAMIYGEDALNAVKGGKREQAPSSIFEGTINIDRNRDPDMRSGFDKFYEEQQEKIREADEKINAALADSENKRNQRKGGGAGGGGGPGGKPNLDQIMPAKGSGAILGIAEFAQQLQQAAAANPILSVSQQQLDIQKQQLAALQVIAGAPAAVAVKRP
jgi:hypothetical protein